MTTNELTIEAMHIYQTLTVLGAVDGDNQTAMQEMPGVLSMLAEKAERVYSALVERGMNHAE